MAPQVQVSEVAPPVQTFEQSFPSLPVKKTVAPPVVAKEEYEEDDEDKIHDPAPQVKVAPVEIPVYDQSEDSKPVRKTVRKGGKN